MVRRNKSEERVGQGYMWKVKKKEPSPKFLRTSAKKVKSDGSHHNPFSLSYFLACQTGEF